MSVTQNSKKTVAIIFAGGQGRRLWPVSTQRYPKQLNPIFSKKTLLKEAFERVAKIFPKERIVIVTTKELEEKTRKLIKLPEKNWIVQPKNVDTAAAMCLAALHLQTLFPGSIAVLVYSDHKIEKLSGFQKAVEDAGRIAEIKPFLIAVGTKPVDANTQFGYIRLGQKVENHLYKVRQFTEKPDRRTAQKYLISGDYVWNTGVYIWQTSVLLDALKKVAPQHYRNLLQLKVLIGTDKYKKAVSAWFESMKPASFEKVVSEKLSKMLVYIANYDWQDVGSWKAVYELAKKDKNKNAILNRAKRQKIDAINSSGNLVFSNFEHVALIGVKDLIVVQTKNSLLICHQDQSGEVKKVA